MLQREFDVRVERLLRHFEREFDYSLQGSGFAGLRGVRAFLESRRGYCTSFAAAAVLLLAPSPPMLFMGEEWAAAEPFLFFCDFEPGDRKSVV